MTVLDKIKVLDTADEIKIFSHPYRIKILDCLTENGIPMTAKQIGTALGEKPSKVHYHVQKLASINVLVLHHTETINGIIAKYYEPVAETITVKMKRDNMGSNVDHQLFNMIDTYFNRAREQFFDELQKAEQYKKDNQLKDLPESRKVNGGLMLEDLYLTTDERSDLLKEIESMVTKYKKRQSPEQKKVHTLLSYMEEFED